MASNCECAKLNMPDVVYKTLLHLNLTLTSLRKLDAKEWWAKLPFLGIKRSRAQCFFIFNIFILSIDWHLNLNFHLKTHGRK